MTLKSNSSIVFLQMSNLWYDHSFKWVNYWEISYESVCRIGQTLFSRTDPLWPLTKIPLDYVLIKALNFIHPTISVFYMYFIILSYPKWISMCLSFWIVHVLHIKYGSFAFSHSKKPSSKLLAPVRTIFVIYDFFHWNWIFVNKGKILLMECENLNRESMRVYLFRITSIMLSMP